MKPRALWQGHRVVAGLGESRAFQYGDGVFRTCLIQARQCVDLDGQVRKLRADAARIGLRAPSAAQLRRDARRLARGWPAGVLKAVLFRSGRGRGYAPTGDRCERLLIASAAPAWPASRWRSGIAVARAGLRLGTQPALAGIKHLNRLEQVVALRAVPRGVVEVLVADQQGHPVGGARTNLFWVRGGTLFTPKLDRCGVAGRMRERLLDCARGLRIRVRIVRAPWRAVTAADEVFVTNSLIGVWPVRRLGARRWRAPGPVTARLAQALRHPLPERR